MSSIVVRKERVGPSNDDPPSYSSYFPSMNPTHTPPPNIRPCNYLSINRDTLTGAFVIDPTLRMPAVLYVGREANLSLYSLGSTDVDVYLLDTGGKPEMTSSKKIKTTVLKIEARDGVIVRLRVCGPNIYTSTRAPYQLALTSKYGSSTLYIPRDFEGILTFSGLSRQSQVRMSSELSERTTLCRESLSCKTYLVGDFERWFPGWSGDQILINCSTRGNIIETAHIMFLDEPETRPVENL